MLNRFNRIPDPKEYFSDPGDRYRIVYHRIINADGVYEIVEKERINVSELVNSYKESTDISYILAKLKAGDTSMLNSNPGVYMDTTKFPKTYAEALQLVINSREAYDTLSQDVKNKFGNDFNKWFSTTGSAEWMENMYGMDKTTLEKDTISTGRVVSSDSSELVKEVSK